MVGKDMERLQDLINQLEEVYEKEGLKTKDTERKMIDLNILDKSLKKDRNKDESKDIDKIEEENKDKNEESSLDEDIQSNTENEDSIDDSTKKEDINDIV